MNTMGGFDWLRHEENIAATPGVVDIGIGEDAVRATGIDAHSLGLIVRRQLNRLIDGGANSMLLHKDGAAVRLYVRRRGRSVDVGTRRDFTDLGWEEICDILDG